MVVQRSSPAFFVLILFWPFLLAGQAVQTCQATLKNDTLTIENDLIARKFLWNNGDLITRSITDKKHHRTWTWVTQSPDAALPGHTKTEGKGDLSTQPISQAPNQADHLDVTVTARLGTLSVRRVFEIYPHVATITCTFYLCGKASPNWKPTVVRSFNAVDFNGIENQKNLNTITADIPVMDKLSLPGNHWKLHPVEFFDMTDRNNTLVKESSYNLYRLPGFLKGNLLTAKELTSGYSFFVLKESPCSDLQLANPGFDFVVKNGSVQTVGMGVVPKDVTETDWVRGYGYTLGLGDQSELATLQTLRSYQDAKHPRRANRDEMVMMNTWGDRNKDAKLSEKFILDELKKATELGITHYQIDDGWQAGRSINSVLATTKSEIIEDNETYWTPDPKRFPNGLKPVLDEANRLHIKISVWFSPNKAGDYRNWEKDARALARLHRDYGIEVIKIDFIQIDNKTAEVNFRRMLDTILKATNYDVAFNMDVTAGRRNGYHYFNEYGNLWLENRYTDWTNYYPYWTLRNLWNLSKYVPAQNLQISFLNKWRNPDKYPANDPFAPARYSFDYLFAITMVAQPMAFFESTGLPPEGFTTGQLVRTYLKNRPAIHGGQIFPIGDEPTGTSWTGFQSIQTDSEGFMLVFREDNALTTNAVSTWLPDQKRVQFRAVAGSGTSFDAVVTKGGQVTFTLPAANSFGLYQYEVLK